MKDKLILERCSIHQNYLKIRAICKHINNNSARNMILLNDGTTVCQECYNKYTSLVKGDIVYICSQCLKELIEKFINRLPDDNIYMLGYPENLNEEKGNTDLESLFADIYQEKYEKGIWK